MFDSDQITHDVVQQITRYFAQLVKTLLQDEANVAKLATEDWDKLIYRLSPLKEEIQLLTRVANGDIPGDLADEDLMGEIADTIDSVCRRLFTVPGSPRHYTVPPTFWNTPLGQVIRHNQLWLRGDDLISYTEAAELLWPDEDVQVARMRIKRMVERGDLTAYTDPREPNPQRAARVSRQDVSEMQL